MTIFNLPMQTHQHNTAILKAQDNWHNPNADHSPMPPSVVNL